MGYTIVTIFLPRSYCQPYSVYPRVGFCLSRGRRTGTLSTRHRRLPGAKMPDFIPPTLWPPTSLDLNPVDYSIWRKFTDPEWLTSTNLKTRLIDQWTCFDQSIMDAAISQCMAPSSQRLCPWTGAHFEQPAYSFNFFVICLPKIIIWKYEETLTDEFSQFFLRNCKV